MTNGLPPNARIIRVNWNEAGFLREVAAAVIRYREVHNLTQAEFAELVYLSKRDVARLERAGADTPAPTLRLLARLTNAPGLDFTITISERIAHLKPPPV